MGAIIVMILVTKCLMDLYLKRLSIKDIGVFVLILVFLCAIFRITSTTSIYNFALLSGLIGMMIDDFETNEVCWVDILLFMICSVIVSALPSFSVRSFLILLIPVTFNLFTKERFIGMADCLITLGPGMGKSPTDLVNFAFYLGVISGIRALIYVIRKEEGEETAFVPVIWLSSLLYVVMRNIF